jgi:bifunctional pyridoxal-dependent enzyme with beta-cystathionase and maltose regulon repressor activities
MSTTKTSRRAILAGASAIPIAAFASTSAPAGETSFPALVARFVRVRERERDRRARDKAFSRLVNNLLDETTGMTKEQRSSINSDDPLFPKFVEEINDAHNQLANERPDLADRVDERGCSIDWNEIQDELSSVSEAMLRQVPRSPADLAWQAEALATSECELWHSDHADVMRELFRNIFALANKECPEHVIAPDEA